MIRRLYRRRFKLPIDSPLLVRPVEVLLLELHEENVIEEDVDEKTKAALDRRTIQTLIDGDVAVDSEEPSKKLDWEEPYLTGDPVFDEWENAVSRGDVPGFMKE